ncbi:MAG: GGDEF domain-containing protein [bacterium]
MRKINWALVIIFVLNIAVFYSTVEWLRGRLESDLIKYTVDLYIAISKNMEYRARKYIEYGQYQPLKTIFENEYSNQGLVYVSVFDQNRKLVISYTKSFSISEYIYSLDLEKFLTKDIEHVLVSEDIFSNEGKKIRMTILISTPVVKSIVSDVQDEIHLGYMIFAFDLTNLKSQIEDIRFYSNLVIYLLSIFSGLVIVFMATQFYRPIEYLRLLAIRFSQAKFSFNKKLFWFEEFNYLVDSFFSMAQAIEQQLRMLESVASMDGLTKLYNRGAFEKFYNAIALECKMKMALGISRNFAVIMMDVDNFKSINDTYGHDVGDRVLVLLADVIRRVKRSTDIASRYGGEEFIIITNVNSKIEALKLALELKNSIYNASVSVNQDIKISVTISIGISFYPDDSIDKDELVRIADQNLYYSKRSGKNKVSLIINGNVVSLSNERELDLMVREKVLVEE